MIELDVFLSFLLDNISDDRISIWKKMKYGYRYYYISFTIDKEDDPSISGFGRYSDKLLICIDNRNICIEIEDSNDENIIIENAEMVSKWSTIFDEFLNSKNDTRISNILDQTLKSCEKKDLYREYKMNKIFKDDEPI